MEQVLPVLIVTIAVATLFNVVLKRYDIPTVIGYVFTGFAVSSFYHFAEDSKEMLMHIAEFGIVFLMFTIGLEFSLAHLKQMKKEVFVYGGLQVGISGLLFSLLAYLLFSLDAPAAIVTGFALALSSTAIVLKILNERGEIHSGYGRVTLGILLFQDLAVIPILLMITFFASPEGSIGAMLTQTAVGAVVIFVALYLAGKYLVEPFFDLITSTESEEIFLIAVLLGVISAAYFAQALGFTYSLGAFLAGMLLSETKYRYRIEADLIPFRDILLGVFFVTIGMLIDWHAIIAYAPLILALLLGVMGLKAAVIYGLLSRFIQRRTALKTALALMQVGEFALAVFALARANDILSADATQVLIITVVLSMIATPFVLKNIKRIADSLIKEPETLRERAIAATGFRNHIIVCGYGPVGERVVEHLKQKGLLYVILEHDVKIVDSVLEKGEEAIYLANAAQKSVLEHFNVEDSAGIIVTVDNEFQRRLICENIVSFSDKVKSVVKVNNAQEEKIYREMGIHCVINARDMVADVMSREILTCSI